MPYEEKITSVNPTFYGNSYCLLSFREDTQSYQTLLKTVRYVLETREIPMPFCAQDVFGRHEYLGGVHSMRRYTIDAPVSIAPDMLRFNRVIRAYLYAAPPKREMNPENDDSESNEDDFLEEIDSSDVLDSKAALANMILDDSYDYRTDRENLRLLREFLAFASECGDVRKAVNEPAGMYYLTHGGYTNETLPRGEKSVFYQLENVLQREEKQRLREQKNTTLV